MNFRKSTLVHVSVNVWRWFLPGEGSVIVPMMIMENAALIQRDQHLTHQMEDVEKVLIQVIQAIQAIQPMENGALHGGWTLLGSVRLVSVLIHEHAGASFHLLEGDSGFGTGLMMTEGVVVVTAHKWTKSVMDTCSRNVTQSLILM